MRRVIAAIAIVAALLVAGLGTAQAQATAQTQAAPAASSFEEFLRAFLAARLAPTTPVTPECGATNGVVPFPVVQSLGWDTNFGGHVRRSAHDWSGFISFSQANRGVSLGNYNTMYPASDVSGVRFDGGSSSTPWEPEPRGEEMSFVLGYEFPEMECDAEVHWSFDMILGLDDVLTVGDPNGGFYFGVGVAEDPTGGLNTTAIWPQASASMQEFGISNMTTGQIVRTKPQSGVMNVRAGDSPKLFVIMTVSVFGATGSFAYIGDRLFLNRFSHRQGFWYTNHDGYFDIRVPGGFSNRSTGIKFETTPIS